jgi:hypothetical protein
LNLSPSLSVRIAFFGGVAFRAAKPKKLQSVILKSKHWAASEVTGANSRAEVIERRQVAFHGLAKRFKRLDFCSAPFSMPQLRAREFASVRLQRRVKVARSFQCLLAHPHFAASNGAEGAGAIGSLALTLGSVLILVGFWINLSASSKRARSTFRRPSRTAR